MEKAVADGSGEAVLAAAPVPLGWFGRIWYKLFKASRVTKGLVNPNTIKFTQDSVKRTFGKGKSGGSLESLIKDLRSGKLNADNIPAIRTFKRDGQTFSLDNRRLKAFQEAGVRIRTRPATAEEIANEAFKFTSKNGGNTVKVRGGGL
jgi:hypothetical protein